jgi:sigma-B regulation protein RsbU (phosphoserine phosphatase)
MPSESDQLRLTDFLDLATLQEIQDSFAAIANVRATVTDAQGNLLTQPVPSREFLRRQQAIALAEAAGPTPSGTGGTDGETAPMDGVAESWRKAGREYIAPIVVNNQRLGTLRMARRAGPPVAPDDAKLCAVAQKLGVDPKVLKAALTQLGVGRGAAPAAIQFLHLLANAIARLCFKEFELRQRVAELETVYHVAIALADARDLSLVLRRCTQLVCDLMDVKASSIRLIDAGRDELVIKAVHNLSEQYLAKGPVPLTNNPIESVALSSRGYEYVANMATDPRILYPEESRREGIVSMLSVGMKYKGKNVGVLRVYTEKEQEFTQLQIDLLKAVAAQAAAAIENARLVAETREAEALERQVQLAAEVQQRMVPQTPPKIPGLDLASVYVPAQTLGGDFFDFIPLPYDNVGLVMADVSGKGIPASLIMASVRAALRAEVDNVFYIYEVIRRLNVMLCRDTEPAEFVTLFYGVLDVPNGRLTYCNAGHPPGLLLRDGKVKELSGGNMVLGTEPTEPYEQFTIDLKPADTLLLYTDGLVDAVNERGEIFGRARVIEALAQAPQTGAEAIAQHILEEMRKFSANQKKRDDVTMTVARID